MLQFDKLVTPLICFILIANTAACTSSPQERVTLNVVSKKQDAQITLDTDGEQAVIDIVSPSGIGNAEFEVTSRTMPKKIVMRFHLRGLEELQFVYGQTVVIGSIASGQDNRVRQHRRGAGNNELEPILPNSPYWMKIDLVAQEGAPEAIPLESGHIQVEAPEDFVQGQVHRFYIQWVDFYR